MTSTLSDNAASTAATATSSRARRDVRRCAEPGGQLWESVGLVTFQFTSGSAFLLQTMEPSIAAVVDKHSTFRTEPLARMQRTGEATLITTYGPTKAAEARVAMVTRMHERVGGGVVAGRHGEVREVAQGELDVVGLGFG